MTHHALALCALALLAAPAAAQDAPAAAEVSPAQAGIVTLTPEQREAAIEAGAARARDESLQNGGSGRRIHGEMGVEVGSGGARAAYGTLVAPIGQNGVAAISYGTGRGPRWHGREWRSQGSSVGVALSNDLAARPTPPAPDAEDVNPD